MPPKRVVDRARNTVQKKAQQLERLEVVYVPRSRIGPNPYNPNRQSDHDFELLCRSMTEDGFTQPVIVNDGTLAPAMKDRIVDGEHRWRAAAEVFGEECEIPVVYAPFTEEQMKISTLRHNRARGSEDVELSAALLRDLQQLGALDHAADSLMLDDVELNRFLTDIPVPEQLASSEFSNSWDPAPASAVMTQENGELTTLGRTAQAAGGATVTAAASSAAVDALRDQEERLLAARTEQEREAVRRDKTGLFRVALVFHGNEAIIVKEVLGNQPAEMLLRMCQERYSDKMVEEQDPDEE